MDNNTIQIFQKYYGKNYKKALKKNNLERKRLKKTFFGKYPYADASRFEFEVTIGKDLSSRKGPSSSRWMTRPAMTSARARSRTTLSGVST
jgi:hypothetical protein